jgi:hypothetical protein
VSNQRKLRAFIYAEKTRNPSIKRIAYFQNAPQALNIHSQYHINRLNMQVSFQSKKTFKYLFLIKTITSFTIT